MQRHGFGCHIDEIVIKRIAKCRIFYIPTILFQIVRDPGAPAKDKLVLLYKQTSSRNPREVFAQCNKLELKRLLIVLVTKCHHHQPHSKTTNLEDIDNDESQESILRRNEEMECDCERRGRENDLRANSPGKASSSAGTATALTDPHDIIALIDDIEEGDEEGQWGGRSLKEHQQQAVRAAVAAAERKY